MLQTVRKALTCVREAEALVAPGGVAVELQPQAIGRAVDDLTRHAVVCEVAEQPGWSVLSVIHLSIKEGAGTGAVEHE